MPTIRLTSYEAFQAPLEYHHAAALFLQQASQDIVLHASALLNQMRQLHPEGAQRLNDTLSEFSHRLSGEANSHANAVTYITQMRIFLSQREADFSGLAPQSFPGLDDMIPPWLQIVSAAPNGCFDALQQALQTYEHDLYSADQKLREFEDLIWKAINHPEELTIAVNWSGNAFADAASDVVNWGAEHTLDPAIQAVADFVRSHEGQIRWLIDTIRSGVETVLLPPIDGHLLQEFIDYVTALHRAYEAHVHEPFVPMAQAFTANYTPPAGQMAYHDSIGSVPAQQANTADALGSLLRRLQSVQSHGEAQAVAQGALMACAVVGVVDVDSLVATALADAPVSVPLAVVDGTEIASNAAETTGIIAAIQGTLLAIDGVITTIPVWQWALAVLIVGSVTVEKIIADTTVHAATIVKTPDGRSIRVRPLTDKEVRALGLHRPKGGQYGATDVIYVELDGNGNPDWDSLWIGGKGGSNVAEFP